MNYNNCWKGEFYRSNKEKNVKNFKSLFYNFCWNVGIRNEKIRHFQNQIKK